jgi:2-aminoadipate transaminase
VEEVIVRRGARLIYLCPDFQNPKGTTLSAERRRLLVEIARRNEVPILEDDPYGELRFRGTAPPAIASLDDEGWVIRLGTFSKTLAPGLRIGWLHGDPELVRRLAIVKQACDLQTATLAQWAAVHTLERIDYDAHLERLRLVYGRRCEAMLTALRERMPPRVRWTNPEGGLFLWLELPDGLRDDEVFAAALEQKVAVVPGSGFFVGAARKGFLRLNYSNQSPESIATGVARLASVIEAQMAASYCLTSTNAPTAHGSLGR